MNEEGFGRHLAGHETTFSQRSKVFIVIFPVLFSFTLCLCPQQILFLLMRVFYVVKCNSVLSAVTAAGN